MVGAATCLRSFLGATSNCYYRDSVYSTFKMELVNKSVCYVVDSGLLSILVESLWAYWAKLGVQNQLDTSSESLEV